MPTPREYEFALPDGSKRYEFVDPDCGTPVLKQIAMFSQAFRENHGLEMATGIGQADDPHLAAGARAALDTRHDGGGNATCR